MQGCVDVMKEIFMCKQRMQENYEGHVLVFLSDVVEMNNVEFEIRKALKNL